MTVRDSLFDQFKNLGRPFNNMPKAGRNKRFLVEKRSVPRLPKTNGRPASPPRLQNLNEGKSVHTSLNSVVSSSSQRKDRVLNTILPIQ